MPIRHIALAGFSPFETQTIESFFKLAGRRPPGYAVVPDVGMADVLLLNSDDGPASARVLARPPTCAVIAIGKPLTIEGALNMARPIRLLSVLEAIEQTMKSREVTAPAVMTPAVSRPPPTAPAVSVASVAPAPVVPAPSPTTTGRQIFTPLPRAAKPPPVVEPPPPPPAPSPVPTAAPPAFRRSRGGLPSFGNSTLDDSQSYYDQKPTPPRSDDDLILVVDDSDIVLRFMQARLQRFGYAVELATSGEEAVQMVQGKDYKFVFLDVMMPGIDGYQTCRLVKKKLDSKGRPPTVVMLSSRGGSIDKIRGTLAGAAAYLTKPLNEAALLKVLADHDEQNKQSFGMTRPATSAMSRL